MARKDGPAPAVPKEAFERTLDAQAGRHYLRNWAVLYASHYMGLRAVELARLTVGDAWDYVPQGIKDATADLRDVLLSGEFGKAKIVHIEHLTVNIARDNATQVVFNQAEFNKLPTEIQDMLMKIRSNIQPDLSTD